MASGAHPTLHCWLSGFGWRRKRRKKRRDFFLRHHPPPPKPHTHSQVQCIMHAPGPAEPSRVYSLLHCTPFPGHSVTEYVGLSRKVSERKENSEKKRKTRRVMPSGHALHSRRPVHIPNAHSPSRRCTIFARICHAKSYCNPRMRAEFGLTGFGRGFVVYSGFTTALRRRNGGRTLGNVLGSSSAG